MSATWAGQSMVHWFCDSEDDVKTTLFVSENSQRKLSKIEEDKIRNWRQRGKVASWCMTFVGVSSEAAEPAVGNVCKRW